MADHKRLQILKRLTTHLQGITVANGFENDIGDRVYRGRTSFGAETEIPALSLLESKPVDYGTYADEQKTVRMDSWTLLLQGWVEDDQENPTDPVYSLLADVEARLAQVIALNPNGKPKYPTLYRLGGLINGMTLAQPIVRPPDEGLSATAYFYLPIQVDLISDLENPTN